VAPGAQSGDMVWMIVTHGLKLVASGIGLASPRRFHWPVSCAACSWASPTDMPTFAAATAVLAAVAAAASYIPARRATRVDPIAPLRTE